MNKETIILGAGCFWCVEAIFTEMKGVLSVEPGYTDGQVEDPTYEEVCNGHTGHVEVARIVFDKEIVALSAILEVFWKTHDPTTLNRQGNDVGTQYRSAVFCESESQLNIVSAFKKSLIEAKAFSKPIVTEIKMLETFYKAEDYHQNYFAQNGEAGYCKMVIQPKVEKFKKVFQTKLK